MEYIVYALLAVNLVLIIWESSIIKNQTINRIAAVEKLTANYRGQIIVAASNVILCIISIIRLTNAFLVAMLDYSYYVALIGDMFICFISFVIIQRHFTPKKASINRYMEIWYRENLKKVEQMRIEGLVPDTYEFKKPTVEEFLDPNWPPKPEVHVPYSAVQEEPDIQPLDSNDTTLPDESDDQEDVNDDNCDAQSLDARVIELLEDNDRIGALQLYMEETGNLLPESLDYIEGLLPVDAVLPELELGDSGFDEQVKYGVLLRTVNDGPVSASRYYSDAYDVDFTESYKQVKEINEEFGNPII